MSVAVRKLLWLNSEYGFLSYVIVDLGDNQPSILQITSIHRHETPYSAVHEMITYSKFTQFHAAFKLYTAYITLNVDKYLYT